MTSRLEKSIYVFSNRQKTLFVSLANFNSHKKKIRHLNILSKKQFFYVSLLTFIPKPFGFLLPYVRKKPMSGFDIILKTKNSRKNFDLNNNKVRVDGYNKDELMFRRSISGPLMPVIFDVFDNCYVEEFIIGRHPKNGYSPCVSEVIASLSSMQRNSLKKVDFKIYVEEYISLLPESIKTKISKYLIHLQGLSVEKLLVCISHGDMNLKNIICTVDSVKLIDWERVGYRSTIFDSLNLMIHNKIFYNDNEMYLAWRLGDLNHPTTLDELDKNSQVALFAIEKTSDLYLSKGSTDKNLDRISKWLDAIDVVYEE